MKLLIIKCRQIIFDISYRSIISMRMHANHQCFDNTQRVLYTVSWEVVSWEMYDRDSFSQYINIFWDATAEVIIGGLQVESIHFSKWFNSNHL